MATSKSPANNATIEPKSHDEKVAAGHATLHRLNMPMLRCKYLAVMPMAMLLPFEARARRNHGQSLERLAERGGINSPEALAIMDDLPFGGVKRCEENEILLLRRVEAYYHGQQAPQAGGEA